MRRHDRAGQGLAISRDDLAANRRAGDEHEVDLDGGAGEPERLRAARVVIVCRARAPVAIGESHLVRTVVTGHRDDLVVVSRAREHVSATHRDAHAGDRAATDVGRRAAHERATRCEREVDVILALGGRHDELVRRCREESSGGRGDDIGSRRDRRGPRTRLVAGHDRRRRIVAAPRTHAHRAIGRHDRDRRAGDASVIARVRDPPRQRCRRRWRLRDSIVNSGSARRAGARRRFIVRSVVTTELPDRDHSRDHDKTCDHRATHGQVISRSTTMPA